MREIGSCAKQQLAGHTDEVAKLPQRGDVIDDGTIFDGACGSTFLDVDTSDLYMFYDGAWIKM